MVVAETGGNLFTNIMSTVEDVWNSGVVKMLEPAIKAVADRLLDKVIDSSVNWAVGGMDDEPGFVNNFGDFVKDTKYDEIINWYDQYSKELANTAQESWNSHQNQGGSSTPGQTAEQNYQDSKSNKLKLKRVATKTIALYGKEALGKNKLAKTLKLEDETLSKYLGGEDKVNGFKTDFSKGGWGGYLELLNPNNTEIGLASIVASEIDKETLKKTEEVITDLQTPVKFLNKTKCLETGVNETTGKEICLREITLTPGEQVSEKVTRSLFKDETKAENSEGLMGSLLKSTVGKLTSKLIDKGLAKLASSATDAIFYNQSQDIFNNGSIDAQFGFNPTGGDGYGDNSTPDLSFSLGNDSTYLGGPEDELGYGEGGAQLIIDLETELENMIKMAAEEQKYFDEIRLAKKESGETIKDLDRCVPGPDYNWEQRLKDHFGATNDQSINLGIKMTKEMFQDPKVNIPGAKTMVSAVDSILLGIKQDDAQNRQRIQALTNVISTLNYVQDQISSRVKQQKQDNNVNLVVFSKEWDLLNTAQKIDAYTYALDNQFSSLLPGETAESVVNTNPDKAKKAVIKAGWQIWVTETNPQEKSDLRYSYFIIQNDLPSEETIARARAQAVRISSSAINSKYLLQDCLVFKAYAFGIQPHVIQEILDQGNTNTLGGTNFSSNSNLFNNALDSLNQISTQLNQLNNIINHGPGGILGGIGGSIGNALGLGGGGNSYDGPDFIDTSEMINDEGLKQFLALEREKQLNNQPSLFATSAVTGGVGNSILGFTTHEEKVQYFTTLYPDDELPYSYIKNALSVISIYKYDALKLLGRDTGALYCRLTQQFRPRHFTPNESACLVGWYDTSDLGYAAALAGI